VQQGVIVGFRVQQQSNSQGRAWVPFSIKLCNMLLLTAHCLPHSNMHECAHANTLAWYVAALVRASYNIGFG
jgi:hypothetical protein